MTVLGGFAGGAVGLGGTAPPVGAEDGADGGVGVGTSVIVLGTPVQMPGFRGTKSAQMPAKKDRAP